MIITIFILTVVNFDLLCVVIFALSWSGGGEFNTLDRTNLHTVAIRTETIMAQLDDLMGALQAIAVDVGQKAQQMLDLEQKLTDINNSTPPSVDLQPAIDLATSIRQSLESTAASATDATATPSPTSQDENLGNTPSSDAGTSSSGSSSDAGSSTGGSDPSVQPPADVTSGDTASGTDSIPQSE